ncbi:MAG: DUF262 domain-containing protein [Kiritimatiellae bacterium]|nr:DUF262 domain-containing protein [Kiritimatiellia bacterium]
MAKFLFDVEFWKKYPNPILRIPLYQRPYSWTDAQIAQLLTDLKNAFQSLSNNQMSPCEDYQLGIVSLAPSLDGTGCLDVVDGQQRLITLMLLVKSCVVKSLETPGMIDFFQGGKRIRFWGRAEDERFLRDIHSSLSSNSRMTAAYTQMMAFWDHLGNEQAKKIAQFISDQLRLHVSFVPSNYSVQERNRFFVRMNNRGKQLEKYEILAARILAKLPETDRDKGMAWWGEVCGTSSREKKKLHEILEEGARGNGTQDTSNLQTAPNRMIIDLESFLLVALDRFKQNRPNAPASISYDKARLLDSFAWLICQPAAVLLEFSEFIAKQRRLLIHYFIWKTQTQIPTRPWQFVRNENDGGEKCVLEEDNGLKELAMLQAYMLVSRDIEKWLPQTLNWLEKQGRSVTVPSFLEYLESIDEQNRALSNAEVDGFSYDKGVPHAVFYHLDYLLWQKRDEVFATLPAEQKPLLDGFHFRRLGSVEHMEPQHVLESSQTVDIDHSFKNLALISAARNSKFSNNPISGKKEIIMQSGYVESLKMLHRLWITPDNKNEHDAEMKRILLQQMAVPGT